MTGEAIEELWVQGKGTSEDMRGMMVNDKVVRSMDCWHRVLESEEGAFGERKCSELGLWQGYVCW